MIAYLMRWGEEMRCGLVAAVMLLGACAQPVDVPEAIALDVPAETTAIIEQPELEQPAPPPTWTMDAEGRLVILNFGETENVPASRQPLSVLPTAAPTPSAEPSTPTVTSFFGFGFGEVEISPPERDDIVSIRVALLLPTGAAQPELADIATDMRNAAELALFSMGIEEVVLIPLDTQGTETGARTAMQEAIEAQADIILGPLLATSVRSSASLAANAGITMIAFSNDYTIQEDHVLLLNFSPQQDVERIISFALNQGIRDFAALLPENAYGIRVQEILSQRLAAAGARLHGVERYVRVIDGPYEPARHLGALAGSEQPGRSLLTEEEKPRPPFHAILLADEGQMLQIAASALAYYDIAPPHVQLLGTHLWDDADVFGEPALQSGWYTAARSENSKAFARRYEEIYGHVPDRLAGLSYDAISLVGLLAREGGDWRNEPSPPQLLLREGGFDGIQGLFRFLPDGRSERALAIWEIEEGDVELRHAPSLSFGGGI